MQNKFQEGMNEAEVTELLQTTLSNGIKTEESAELNKYKSLSATYYPAYQRNIEQKNLFDKLNKKLPAAFPKILRAEGGEILSAERFMVIIYVKERVTADEAGRLKNFLESELEMPVTLNIQLDSEGASNLISGNGISW